MKENKFQESRENFIEGIDNEFQGLANQLKNMDFSKESNKNFVLNTTLENLNNEGERNMNQIKKTGIVAASLLIVSTLVAQTTFAQDTVNRIIKTISLGHISMVQDEGNEPEEIALGDSLKGKVFDKNGNELEKINRDIVKNGVYTKDGEKIASWSSEDGSIITEKQATQSQNNTLYVTDKGKLNEYTCFDVKLPTYLPYGYEFDKAEFYKDETGNVKDSKYVNLYFKNKLTRKDIYMQQRFACEETKSVGNAEKIEKIKINGADAILSNDRSINWEANNTIYFLSGKNIGKDEAIKIAESIK